MIAKNRGWHIELTRNPKASWEYCIKDEGRMLESIIYG